MSDLAVSDLDLVPLEVIEPWLDEHGVGSGPLTEITQLTGGTQNILIRFVRDGHAYVLRRGPRHKRDNSDEAMRREARVLAALTGSKVPHPGFVAACDDAELIGGAFYVMDAIDEAFNARVAIPGHIAADLSLQHVMGETVVDGLAALGEVDYLRVGLEGFGKPAGWVERQVDRWAKQLASYAVVEAWPGPQGIPHLEDVTAWLRERQVISWKPGILHGDYHVGNVMFDIDTARLSAVVDWELSTIGDPLLDFGQLLASLPSASSTAADSTGTLAPSNLPGFITHAKAIERYASQSSRDLSEIAWYRVLACYRLGIVLEGSYARMFAGLATPEIGEQLHATTVELFEQAARVIGDGDC